MFQVLLNIQQFCNIQNMKYLKDHSCYKLTKYK